MDFERRRSSNLLSRGPFSVASVLRVELMKSHTRKTRRFASTMKKTVILPVSAISNVWQ